MAPRRELLVFDFAPPRARFEGTVLGALERAESGGAMKVLEVLVLTRDPDSGELGAVRLEGGADLIAAGIDVRLDERRRHEASTTAVDPDVTALGETVEHGGALLVIAVEHGWAEALEGAVQRSGGRLVADEPVAAGDDLAIARRALATRA